MLILVRKGSVLLKGTIALAAQGSKWETLFPWIVKALMIVSSPGDYRCTTLRTSKEHATLQTALLAYLKPNGVMIFDYYTNLCERRKSESWIYHSLEDVNRHNPVFEDARLEPLLDQADHARVVDPVLQETDQPGLVDRVEV